MLLYFYIVAQSEAMEIKKKQGSYPQVAKGL